MKKKNVISREVIELEAIYIDIILVINIIDLKSWIKKYLIEASKDSEIEELIINGINENKFNSIPIHKNSQWEADKDIKVPKIRQK